MTDFRIQERIFGPSVVFRVVPGQLATTLASQLPCRERWVLLLLDGRRSVADLARLTERSELDIAYTLARFLQWGYVEPRIGQEALPNARALHGPLSASVRWDAHVRDEQSGEKSGKRERGESIT